MHFSVIIVKACKWLKSHILHIFIILFFLIIIVCLTLDNLFLEDNLNKAVYENTPVINLVIGVAGMGSVVIVYKDYLAQKQHEAVFGFYLNMRIFLKRLDVFLGDNFSESEIIVKLYTKTALDKYSNNTPTPQLIDAFHNLCVEFMNFLCNSKDNIPAKRGNREFVNWYESQMSIVELLQQGILCTDSSYGDYSDRNALEKFYNNIKDDIEYIDRTIKEKVKEDSML